jgi:hypothetical protein
MSSNGLFTPPAQPLRDTCLKGLLHTASVTYGAHFLLRQPLAISILAVCWLQTRPRWRPTVFRHLYVCIGISLVLKKSWMGASYNREYIGNLWGPYTHLSRAGKANSSKMQRGGTRLSMRSCPADPRQAFSAEKIRRLVLYNSHCLQSSNRFQAI